MSQAERLSRLRARGGVLVAPSVLSCDFGHVADEVRAVEAAGADLLHLDVMDGHFVPNLTLGVPVVKSIRRATDLPLDVHLMITDPAEFADPFIEAGADILTFHIEAAPDPGRLLERIRAAGVLAGLVVKPATPVEALADYAALADLILVMSVEPGFGGQAFIPEAVPKIADARRLLDGRGWVEIDGGINAQTAPQVVEAGAQILVAGTAVFGQADYAQAVAGLKAGAGTDAGPAGRADS